MRDDARGGRAALPGRAERTAVDGRRGLVEVGVGHDDDGVLAAHLTRDLGAALRGLHVEFTADAVRAGERDGAQFGRVHHRFAHFGAAAHHHVEHTGRQSGLFVDFGQDGGGGRHELRRLEHHAVAGDEGRRRLPHRDRPRKVPRRDEAHGAERLAQRVGEAVAGFRRQRAAVHAEALAGVVLEQRDALHHLALGFAQDLAFFARERGGDLVGTAARDVGSAPEHAAALGPGRLAPARPRGLRGVDGPLHVGLGRERELGDHIRGVGRIDVARDLARVGVIPGAVDVGAGVHTGLTLTRRPGMAGGRTTRARVGAQRVPEQAAIGAAAPGTADWKLRPRSAAMVPATCRE